MSAGSVITPVSSRRLLIWVFFLCCFVSLARGLIIFLIFSKNKLLVSLIFLYCFAFFNIIYFCSYLIISFLLLALDLLCSSSMSLRWDLRPEASPLFCKHQLSKLPSQHCASCVPPIRICNIFILIQFKYVF